MSQDAFLYHEHDGNEDEDDNDVDDGDGDVYDDDDDDLACSMSPGGVALLVKTAILEPSEHTIDRNRSGWAHSYRNQARQVATRRHMSSLVHFCSEFAWPTVATKSKQD